MIKNFNEFNVDDIKDNEIRYFERELNARKKMRAQKSENNDSNIEDIKDFILAEIQNKEDYHITTGKRMITIDGVKKEEINIEYESPESGRVRVFKPNDDSTEGYYEINGKMFHTDADSVRNFYHLLNQEVKNKPVVEKNVYSFDEFIQEGIFSDRYKDDEDEDDEDEDDDSGIFSRKHKKDNDDDINIMSHLANDDEIVEEGFKEIALATLLFLASCTSIKVKDQDGNKINPPTDTTINGYVEKETYLPNKGGYLQFITIKGDDGNSYKYTINNNQLISKSWRINNDDSVKMIFDKEGDSKVYKIK